MHLLRFWGGQKRAELRAGSMAFATGLLARPVRAAADARVSPGSAAGAATTAVQRAGRGGPPFGAVAAARRCDRALQSNIKKRILQAAAASQGGGLPAVESSAAVIDEMVQAIATEQFLNASVEYVTGGRCCWRRACCRRASVCALGRSTASPHGTCGVP